MNVFLLPHHPLDPRFRYCLEREHRRTDRRPRAAAKTNGWFRRFFRSLKAALVTAKTEYDYLVHGHEQIRLSRLVLQMSRDPNLTIVIPHGMTQEWALEAVRGVIRSGLMRHRAHLGRNLLTAGLVQVILVLAVPTHVLGLLFLPVIIGYGIQRYREDRLIRKNMETLLHERLANGVQRFREDTVLHDIEGILSQVPQPSEAYRRVLDYLDICDGTQDSLVPEHLWLVAKYYSDIGRWDPYERFQDRAMRSIMRALKRAKHEIVRLWWKILGPLLRKLGFRPPDEPSADEEHEDELGSVEFDTAETRDTPPANKEESKMANSTTVRRSL